MDTPGPLSYSGPLAKTILDEDLWDEVADEFSDSEHGLSTEENDVVILPVAHRAPSRTVWEILADRLAESSFKAKFVDLEQRKLNAAAMKKRCQLDPEKRHTWTSKCGHYQVVGYFTLYVRGTVGLFTEEGFPVYVKLDELSDEDVKFVIGKLGDPLRGKVEVQRSITPHVNQTEQPTGTKNDQMAQESSITTRKQEGTNGAPQCMTHKGH